MKTFIRSFSLILLVVFAFSSCEKNSDSSKGTAKFSVSSIDEFSQLKSAWTDDDLVSYHLMVSVEDSDGNPVLTGEMVPVYLFGSSYISEELEMEAGNYRLTEFMLLDPAGEVTALILHSVVNMWGFSVYKKGELLRSASGAEGEFFGSAGAPLPEEESVLAEHPIETIDSGEVAYSEELVFEVARRVLGHRYDEDPAVDELKCSHFKRNADPPGKKSFLSRLFG